MKWLVYATRAVTAGSTLGFVLYFNPASARVSQLWIDLLLVLALAAWGLATVITARAARPMPRIQRTDLAIIACSVAAFCALWLPHFDNWRWAYTGDSVAWFSLASTAATKGLRQNPLNMHGVDFHFTYPHSLASNSFMFVFEPTLFWHRAGKLVASALSLTSIFLFFRVTVGRWWAVAITLCTAANYLWLWMSYVSYGHIDSFIYYFNGFTLAALIWRRRDDSRLWFLAGLNAGLSLYFTQMAWSGVALSGLCLIGLALRYRLFANLIVCGVTFGICAAPIVLQWDGFMHLISSQARPVFDWEYLKRTFMIIVALPYRGMYMHYLGVVNGFLRPPLSESYVLGILIALAASIPAARRFLRLPRVAPALLAMFLFDIVLLTLTNNGYPQPSPKRAYNLIPTQIFLSLVPGMVLCEWLRATRTTRTLASAAVASGLALYLYGSIGTLLFPPDFTYASTAYDGFIELRQRHPGKHSAFFTSNKFKFRDFQPGTFFDRSYGLAESVTAVQEFTPERLEQACRDGHLVCAEHTPDRDRLAELRDRSTRSFAPYPTINSRGLRCFECLGAGRSQSRKDHPDVDR